MGVRQLRRRHERPRKRHKKVKKKFICAKKDAYSRLLKLRKETLARRSKEDELTCLSKAMSCSEKELEIMKCIFDTLHETKHFTKKEWIDKDDDGRRTRRGRSR